MLRMIATLIVACVVSSAVPARAQDVLYQYGCGGAQMGPGLGNKIFGYSDLSDPDHIANGDQFQSEVSIDGWTLDCKLNSVRIGPGGCKRGPITVSNTSNSAYAYGEVLHTGYYGNLTSRHKMWWIVDGYWYLTNSGSNEVNNCYVNPPLPCPPGQYCPPTPILVPLEKSPEVKMSGPEVLFDLDADGDLDVVGWPENAGFLVQDRNGDGLINDGRELYGSATTTGANNGFDALAREAGINTIDATVPLYNKLQVWHDANRDGVTQPGELAPVSRYLRSIFLFYKLIGKKDPQGNEFRFQGQAVYVDGEQRPIYDVIFATQQ